MISHRCAYGFIVGLLLAFSPVNLEAQMEGSLDYTTLEKIPLRSQGREKPLYSFAVESLQTLYGRARLPREDGSKLSTMEAFCSLWFAPEGWVKSPVILFDHKPLKRAVGLAEDQKHFSYQELIENEKLTQQILEVRQLTQFNQSAELNKMQQEAREVGQRLDFFSTFLSQSAVRLVPHPNDANAPWEALAHAQHYYPDKSGEDLAMLRQDLQKHFQAQDGELFSQSVATLEKKLIALAPDFYPTAASMEREVFYLKFHPFRLAWVAYLLGGILLLTTFSSNNRFFRGGVWLLVITGFSLQVMGFVYRILISGRPPVTNMYESILWVAFAAILFAIILELIIGGRYFLLGAIPVAVVSLILADSQPTVLSPAINPLVAVLRDNFWLTTHVLTITLSYGAFALALGVGHVILVQCWRKRSDRVPGNQHLYLYRTLQIGVLLLAAGTLLGAFWAKASWGRFWDWDPKETWAFIALLFYLALLHGRIVGLWGGFGLALGSILAFQSIIMAWYGVNFVLGVGLHSYGFGSGGVEIALGFVALEIAFLALCWWRCKSGKQLQAS